MFPWQTNPPAFRRAPTRLPRRPAVRRPDPTWAWYVRVLESIGGKIVLKIEIAKNSGEFVKRLVKDSDSRICFA